MFNKIVSIKDKKISFAEFGKLVKRSRIDPLAMKKIHSFFNHWFKTGSDWHIDYIAYIVGAKEYGEQLATNFLNDYVHEYYYNAVAMDIFVKHMDKIKFIMLNTEMLHRIEHYLLEERPDLGKLQDLYNIILNTRRQGLFLEGDELSFPEIFRMLDFLQNHSKTSRPFWDAGAKEEGQYAEFIKWLGKDHPEYIFLKDYILKMLKNNSDEDESNVYTLKLLKWYVEQCRERSLHQVPQKYITAIEVTVARMWILVKGCLPDKWDDFEGTWLEMKNVFGSIELMLDDLPFSFNLKQQIINCNKKVLLRDNNNGDVFEE